MIENSNDTIIALATKAGESAINIIKISGNKSVKMADSIFSSINEKKLKEMETYTMSYGKIYDEKNEVIDEVIVSVMRAPKSYTREDVVEINCHGGLISVNKIIDLLLNKGARLAEPGEFTKRAFLNGRVDLSQAEAVIDIINAKNINSLKIAANNLTGDIKNIIKKIKEKIVDIIVELEAGIDFIEEDLEVLPITEIKVELRKIRNDLKELIENEKKSEIIKEGIRVAIAGKPNVGKSSLLNLMTGKEKSIVTHIPGTTRDIIEETINMEGIPIIFKDTAGLRESKNFIEKIGVKKSKDEIERSDIVIVMIDNSREVTEDDIRLLRETEEKKRIIVLNKIDLRKKADLIKIIRKSEESIIEISVKEKKGIEKIIGEIKKLAIGESEFIYEEKIIVNKRQRLLLEKALKDIESALKTINMDYSEEFIITDLTTAKVHLAEIIGEDTSEEVLDKIFSKFCIGK
jgi:tRNA modification GTPase